MSAENNKKDEVSSPGHGSDHHLMIWVRVLPEKKKTSFTCCSSCKTLKVCSAMAGTHPTSGAPRGLFSVANLLWVSGKVISRNDIPEVCKASGHAFDKVNQEPLNDVQGKTTFALNHSDIRVKLARGKSSCRGASHLKSNSFKPSVCILYIKCIYYTFVSNAASCSISLSHCRCDSWLKCGTCACCRWFVAKKNSNSAPNRSTFDGNFCAKMATRQWARKKCGCFNCFMSKQPLGCVWLAVNHDVNQGFLYIYTPKVQAPFLNIFINEAPFIIVRYLNIHIYLVTKKGVPFPTPLSRQSFASWLNF